MARRYIALALLGACGGGSGGDAVDASPGADVRLPDRPQAELDAALDDAYAAWKAAYLEPACTAGRYRVKTAPDTADYTVSEGHGYGMLATALMGDQLEFDGLKAYFLDHPSANDPGLMAWAQDASCADVDGPDSATDGDLDIAYALLLDGDTDTARTVIASILASEVHPAGSILVGDWAGAGDAHYTGTRPSDFMPGHFRAFGAATGVARWDDVVDKTYANIAALQRGYAPDTGLLPDFAIDADTDHPSPAPAGWLEGPDDGRFAYNACRTPWRIALDAGDPRARAAVQPVEAWAKATTGGDVSQLVNGYALDGTPTGDGPDLPFLAPMAAGSIVTDDQAWVDASWDALVAAGPSGSYYGDSLRLLAMIAMTGHWRTP